LECTRMRACVAAYRAGTSHPGLVEIPADEPGVVPAVVHWRELRPADQMEAINAEIARMEAECKVGEQHVTRLSRLIHEVREGVRPPGPDRRKVIA